ncbi:winged helix DNA-binding domain-containing protein [Nocardiopsis valliformis]
MAATLSRRELNRATLDRQFLLHRVDRPATEMLARLIGLQAQTTHTWYVGFQSRLEDPDPRAVGRLLTDGSLVRMSLMRSTLHLVSAEDAAWIRPTTQEVMDKDLAHSAREGHCRGGPGRGGGPRPGTVEGAPAHPQRAGGTHRSAVGGRARRPSGLRGALSAAGRAGPAARGVGRLGATRSGPADTWTGRPFAPGPDREALVLRYLAAFGPASVRDVQAWSGLTRLKEVVEELRERLVSFRDEAGVELFDLPEAPRPSADVPAPARFLYDFDNLLRGHADRNRVISAENLKRISSRNGMPPATVLVDGEVAAVWKVDRSRQAPSLDITPFRFSTTRKARRSSWKEYAFSPSSPQVRRVERSVSPPLSDFSPVRHPTALYICVLITESTCGYDRILG